MNTKFLAQYLSFQDIIRYGRQAFETIKQYDVALTEMNKVSEESIHILKEFQNESFELADTVGTTASQIQNSTADFMRLGESLEEAKQSAKDANVLLQVSEFQDISEATDALVAMSAAYKDLEKSQINDVLNEIGNNYSISTDQLASALQRSAATLSVAGNDIYEASALITAGNAILQDAESVGTGLKMISLRILGTEEAKNELASLGEDVDDFVVQTKSKLDETIRNYTAVASNNYKGVSVLDDNGNYKSTYEILSDISEVYQEILEADKKAGTNRGQALLEVLAGKNRSNVAASILNNPELLKSVYESARNSKGSAQEELDKQLDSIEGHLNQLKNAWDEIWINENNREFITGIIDALKGLLNIVNDLGGLKAILMAIPPAFAAVKSFKGDGKWGFKNVLISLNMPSVI
jgi:TP901 family phage tail tape measure protein